MCKPTQVVHPSCTLIGVMPSPMQLKETQEALAATAQEGFTNGNAILSLVPTHNTTPTNKGTRE